MLNVLAVVLRMRHNALEVNTLRIRAITNSIQVLPNAMQSDHALYLGGLHKLLQPVADAVTRRQYPAFVYYGAATKVSTTSRQAHHKGHFIAFRLVATHNLRITHSAGKRCNYRLHTLHINRLQLKFIVKLTSNLRSCIFN